MPKKRIFMPVKKNRGWSRPKSDPSFPTGTTTYRLVARNDQGRDGADGDGNARKTSVGEAPMPDDLLYANGIDAATGGPLLPALATGTLAKVAARRRP